MIIPRKYKNKVAWSNYLKTYIRVTSYWTNNIWWFVRCDSNGIWKDSKRMRAGSNITIFDWEDIVKKLDPKELGEKIDLILKDDLEKIHQTLIDYPVGSKELAEIVELSGILKSLGVNVTRLLESEIYSLKEINAMMKLYDAGKLDIYLQGNGKVRRSDHGRS